MDNRLFAANPQNNEKHIDNFLDAGPATLLGTECTINGMLPLEVTIPKAFCRKTASLFSNWQNSLVSNYRNAWGANIDWNDHQIIASSGTFKFNLKYREKECQEQIALFQDFFKANGFKTELHINADHACLTFTAMDKDITLFINKYPHNCGGKLQAVKFDNTHALFNEPENSHALIENEKCMQTRSFK